MDLTYASEHEQFRQEIRHWIRQNLPDAWKKSVLHPSGENYKVVQAWDQKLYADGWAGLVWPKEYGGKGASLIEQMIFTEELALAEAPDGYRAGSTLLAPTLLAFGSEEQKRKYLPGILSAETIWCQGFSEPNAGSDMANLQCRAVISGDELVINGQKIWTSLAHVADWCFALVRTDTSVAKHKGITFVLIDMNTPGITVRPVVQIDKRQEFNELFFEDVRVPLENVVGGLNKGWYVAMTTLGHERGSAYFRDTVEIKIQLELLAELARSTMLCGRSALHDSAIRQRLAQAYMDVQVFRYGVLRTVSSLIKGEQPGPESFIAKLWWSELRRRMVDLAMDIEGPYGQLMQDSRWTIMGSEWTEEFIHNRSETIYAGTSEIQRNILAERVLDLPR